MGKQRSKFVRPRSSARAKSRSGSNTERQSTDKRVKPSLENLSFASLDMQNLYVLNPLVLFLFLQEAVTYKELRFDVHKIEANGNCLFRALSHQVQLFEAINTMISPNRRRFLHIQLPKCRTLFVYLFHRLRLPQFPFSSHDVVNRVNVHVNFDVIIYIYIFRLQLV